MSKTIFIVILTRSVTTSMTVKVSVTVTMKMTMTMGTMTMTMSMTSTMTMTSTTASTRHLILSKVNLLNKKIYFILKNLFLFFYLTWYLKL